MERVHLGWKHIASGAVALAILLAGGIWLYNEYKGSDASASLDAPASAADPLAQTPGREAALASTPPKEKKTLSQLIKLYGELGLTDVHNHDASDAVYRGMVGTWKRASVGRVVLFGDASEPSAVNTDALAWRAYEENPGLIVPFFSGFDLHSPSSLDTVRANLEKGYMGLGEIVAASTSSPVVSKVLWKGYDPMDGYLPQIYELCAEYKAPILLHIDPPNGYPTVKLEEALDAYPDTAFIFAHINAFQSPEPIDILMGKHPNLYADFSAGFTYLSPESWNKLDDFIPLMRKYPDRFLLSTDSGYGLESEEAAIGAMYQLLDLLGEQEIARKIASGNFDALIRDVPATKTQLEAIAALEREDGGISGSIKPLSKLEAGKLLIDNKVILK